MDSNQRSHFASLVRSSSQSASCFAAARMTCCSLRFRSLRFPAQGCRPFFTENEHTGSFSGRFEPRFIRHRRRFGSAPNRCERCALTWWSSLQQNDVAVFNPLKTLISKESADFVLSRRVFAKGCSRGCSRSSVHPVCSLSSRFFLLTRR